MVNAPAGMRTPTHLTPSPRSRVRAASKCTRAAYWAGDSLPSQSGQLRDSALAKGPTSRVKMRAKVARIILFSSAGDIFAGGTASAKLVQWGEEAYREMDKIKRALGCRE